MPNCFKEKKKKKKKKAASLSNPAPKFLPQMP